MKSKVKRLTGGSGQLHVPHVIDGRRCKPIGGQQEQHVEAAMYVHAMAAKVAAAQSHINSLEKCMGSNFD